jgi:hypothetical protein
MTRREREVARIHLEQLLAEPCHPYVQKRSQYEGEAAIVGGFTGLAAASRRGNDLDSPLTAAQFEVKKGNFHFNLLHALRWLDDPSKKPGAVLALTTSAAELVEGMVIDPDDLIDAAFVPRNRQLLAALRAEYPRGFCVQLHFGRASLKELAAVVI